MLESKHQLFQSWILCGGSVVFSLRVKFSLSSKMVKQAGSFLKFSFSLKIRLSPQSFGVLSCGMRRKTAETWMCLFVWVHGPANPIPWSLSNSQKCKRIASKVSKCKFKFYFCAFMDINCHVFMTVKCNGFYYIFCLLQVSSAKKVCVPCVPVVSVSQHNKEITITDINGNRKVLQ